MNVGGKEKTLEAAEKEKQRQKNGKKTNMVKWQRKVEEGGLPRGQGILVIFKNTPRDRDPYIKASAHQLTRASSVVSLPIITVSYETLLRLSLKRGSFLSPAR